MIYVKSSCYQKWNKSLAPAYHPVFSFVTRYTDELGVVATYDYDDQGNLLEHKQAVDTPVELLTVYTYDNYCRVETRSVKGATPRF